MSQRLADLIVAWRTAEPVDAAVIVVFVIAVSWVLLEWGWKALSAQKEAEGEPIYFDPGSPFPRLPVRRDARLSDMAPSTRAEELQERVRRREMGMAPEQAPRRSRTVQPASPTGLSDESGYGYDMGRLTPHDPAA